LMTAVIDKAIEAGIYVLIDWHDHNAELHLEE
jgi:endoglucanase